MRSQTLISDTHLARRMTFGRQPLRLHRCRPRYTKQSLPPRRRLRYRWRRSASATHIRAASREAKPRIRSPLLSTSLTPASVNPALVAPLERWLVLRADAALNVVSEDATDLAIETVSRAGFLATLVVRRYVMRQPKRTDSFTHPFRRRLSSTSPSRINAKIPCLRWQICSELSKRSLPAMLASCPKMAS